MRVLGTSIEFMDCPLIHYQCCELHKDFGKKDLQRAARERSTGESAAV